MRFPRFGILVFISYCIFNQKYFDLGGSCESHNIIEIPFEDLYEYYMDYIYIYMFKWIIFVLKVSLYIKQSNVFLLYTTTKYPHPRKKKTCFYVFGGGSYPPPQSPKNWTFGYGVHFEFCHIMDAYWSLIHGLILKRIDLGHLWAREEMDLQL